MSNAAKRVYLDHNATTPLCAPARDEISAALELFGNPSSIHEEGRAARDLVELARRRVAAALGADGSEVVFTSGGTEADCLGILGLARLARGSGAGARAVTTPIEHPAVAGALSQLADAGMEVSTCRVDANGRIDLADLSVRVRQGAALVAVALANHEIGTVQPIAEIIDIARAAGAVIHVDAVQAFGKLPVDVRALGADTVAISAHKIYGPKGSGALWIRRDRDLGPVIPAGHQERGRRPGTENVLGIVGLGKAAELAAARVDDHPRIAALGDRLADGLAALGAVIHARDVPRIRTTVNARFAGAPGDVLVQALDLEGFAASTGAACTSGSVEPSPVLLGIGLPREQAKQAIRLSLGVSTTTDDIEALLEVLPAIVARAQRFA